jgi:hypothetical protein
LILFLTEMVTGYNIWHYVATDFESSQNNSWEDIIIIIIIIIIAITIIIIGLLFYFE